MKIIHLTDLHYGKKKEAIYGMEPAYFLQKAVDSINLEYIDSSCCILTGDLTNDGCKESYEYLKSDLDRLKIPYYPLIGNHDNRKNAIEAFSHKDCNGFFQYSFALEDKIFIMLDSVKEGSHAGEFCQKRQEWLINELNIYSDKEVFICIHHAPFNTGLKAMDKIRLDRNDSIKLYRILSNHSNVRHIFFGHYHTALAGNWGRISFSTLRGISHQVKLDLYDEEHVKINRQTPQYSIILIDENMDNGQKSICVYFKEFMLNNDFYTPELPL